MLGGTLTNLLTNVIRGDPGTTGFTPANRGVDLYVSCALDGDIEEFNTNGDLIGQFGSFTTPMGIADSADRYYWIADAAGALYEYNWEGDCIITVTSHLISPWGVVIDIDGNLWVTDAGNGCVSEFNLSSGDYIGSFGSGTLSVPQFLTIDGMGNFWVVDAGNKCVSRFDNNKAYINSFGSEVLSGPQGIMVY